MKLKVEKLPSGDLRFTIVTGSDRKPVVVTLTPAQVQAFLFLVEGARKADRFSFELEL